MPSRMTEKVPDESDESDESGNQWQSVVPDESDESGNQWSLMRVMRVMRVAISGNQWSLMRVMREMSSGVIRGHQGSLEVIRGP